MVKNLLYTTGGTTMPYNLSDYLVIGISSRALFDLTKENEIFQNEGREAYCKYQLEHEEEILEKGAGFNLIEGFLRLNDIVPSKRKVEVIIMSKNNPDTSLRIFNSIEHYGLDIARAALTSGQPLTPYLKAFSVDLFLSSDEGDVQEAVDAGFAAGLIYNPQKYDNSPLNKIKIAFDGDAVLFSDEAERIYKAKGLDAFVEHERHNAKKPLPEGPFAKLLKTIAFIQSQFDPKDVPIRTALVTARGSHAHERVIRTLRAWNVRIDEAFFLGGAPKDGILEAFGAHIFFDDQDVHLEGASKVVPSAKVPYKTQVEVDDTEE